MSCGVGKFLFNLSSLISRVIILVLRYPGIERFYSLAIIFIRAFQTGDGVNSSRCFWEAGEFLTIVIVLEYKFWNKGRLHIMLQLLERTIVRQHQCSWWFFYIKGRRIVQLFFGCRENLINKMFLITKVAEYNMQKLNIRVIFDWTTNLEGDSSLSCPSIPPTFQF